MLVLRQGGMASMSVCPSDRGVASVLECPSDSLKCYCLHNTEIAKIITSNPNQFGYKRYQIKAQATVNSYTSMLIKMQIIQCNAEEKNTN